MAYTKLVLGLQQSNSAVNTTYTFSATNVSWAAALQQIQNCTQTGGILADNNNWYPVSAILWIQAQ